MLSLIREERNSTPKDSRELFNMYWQEPEEYTCDWILMKLNQGGPEIRLYKKNLFDLGLPSWDVVFNTLPRTPGNGTNLTYSSGGS